jgi:hypothetical protein
MRVIDADKLKEVLERNFGHTGGASVLAQLIDAQPTIQPEQKRGEWIYDWGDWDFETCKCSECGNHMTTPIGKRYNFCPNCGAKMDEVTT